jgi:hypothetical protein
MGYVFRVLYYLYFYSIDIADNDIRMDFKEVGCEVVNWIHLAQDMNKLKDSSEYDDKLSSSVKGGEFHDLLRDNWLLKNNSVPRINNT